MAQTVTIGGDRLGSGKKQKISLHNYEMSSFNLEQDWKSSMAPGILYPFIKMVGTNHGTFDIDLDTFVRTIPTKGPLFGSYKLQLDLFLVPFRLYQGILHNNPVSIGMKMNQVYLPNIEITTKDGKGAVTVVGSDKYNRQINDSALLKYLGISGLGCVTGASQTAANITRSFNAIPILAYYDIFKNYYSNKQEELAYVITPGVVEEKTILTSCQVNNAEIPEDELGPQDEMIDIYISNEELNTIQIKGINLNKENIIITFTYQTDQGYSDEDYSIKSLLNLGWTLNKESDKEILLSKFGSWKVRNNVIIGANYYTIQEVLPTATADIALTPFELSNIDEMRSRLLSVNTLGQRLTINESTNLLPYSALVNRSQEGITWNAFTDNGLVVKTYQSDLFNNWLDTEWIDGENGISALTSVAIVDGKFSMDTLNLQEKRYEIFNRIAVSGGTYEDWQEAVYGEGAIRKAETPMFCGGMEAEIMFEEVISSTEAGEGDEFQALGQLAGKGTQIGKNGGNNIHIKVEEPSYIMGIVSITPRICYTQGNDWDMTELDTLDDLHKPGLDGIGFQDLIVEQMAWWDTTIAAGSSTIVNRNSAGKQTAWINYQTAVDKAFGDFARSDGKAFMVLSRNYEMTSDFGGVKDLTTYIDPSKYNYAFAVTNLASQNFWVQIHSKVIARRKMGAQQIPNL